MEDPVHIEYLEGPSPMQGWGTIAGFPFYFRARHEQWSFAVSTDGRDPIDINSAEQGFYIEQDYGKPRSFAASNMLREEAEALIYQCAERFKETLNTSNIGQEGGEVDE